MTGVAWPFTSEHQSRAELAACANNLRRVGLAMQLWATDHGGEFPFRVRQDAGGTLPAGGAKVGLTWYEYAWVSNQLVTPAILACPSDPRTIRVARNFSNAADGGFLNSGFRNNAVSYFIGTDAFGKSPKSWLAGDYNLAVQSVNSACSAGINDAARIDSFGNPVVAWTNAVHGLSGNILFVNGEVRHLSTASLRDTLRNAADDNGAIHILQPH